MIKKNESANKGLGQEIKKDWLSVVLIVTTLLIGFLIYPHLPERVPSHWNVQGQVDSYSSRMWGAFGLPLMTLGVYLLMVLIPRFDPKKENYVRFQGAYRLLKLVLVMFLTILYAVIIMNAMGYPVKVDRVVTIAVGMLFMVIGNFMGQLRHNYFVGIKTPWTLASEEVWNKTHRFGSRVWVVCGLAIAVIGLFMGGQSAFIVMMASIAAAVLLPMVHAYLSYKKLNHN